MKKHIYKKIAFGLIGAIALMIVSGILLGGPAFAESPTVTATPQFEYKPTYLPNIIKGATTPGVVVNQIYIYLVGLVGVVAVGVIIYAGVLRTISASGDKIKKSTQLIKNVLTGIVLLFGTQVLFNTINENIIDVERIDEALKTAIPKIEPKKDESWWDKLGDLVPGDEVPTAAENAGSKEAAVNMYGGLPGTAALAAKIQPCKDCVLVPSFGAGFLTSSNACFGAATGDKGRGGCYENKTLVDKLTALQQSTAGTGLKWQVTGSYPPGADHASKCHWDGTCLDIQLIGCPGDCTASKVNAMLDKAIAAGFAPYNEYRVGRNPKDPDTRTGNNIHLNLPGITTK